MSSKIAVTLSNDKVIGVVADKICVMSNGELHIVHNNQAVAVFNDGAWKYAIKGFIDDDVTATLPKIVAS